MNTATESPTLWIVAADARRAVLFACARRPQGRTQVQELRRTETTWENMHEHARPTALGSGTPPHFAGPNHDREEEIRRFARDTAAWVRDAARELSIPTLRLYAPPRVLSELRALLRGAPGIDLYEGELTHLRPAELADHPIVRAWRAGT
jgi:hypothetical protein